MNQNSANNWSILDLDTKLFGFKVAKLIPSRLNLIQLQKILSDLKKLNVKLVFWASDRSDEVSQEAACELDGFLADMKVTYATITELKNLPLGKIAHCSEIVEYQNVKPSKKLQELAVQVGEYSHFKTDPRFPAKLFVKMYRTWIANAVNHTVAKHVLVYKKNRSLAGFITLGEKNGRGDIGLLAVDAAFRGQGIGQKLVTAAQKQFLEDGYKFSQVVTQLGNLSACRLYEKCGYQIEKVENFYHFWL